MKTLIVLAGAVGVLAAAPSAASACGCAVSHHAVHRAASHAAGARPVHRVRYAHVVRREAVRPVIIKKIYVTRVVRMPVAYPEPVYREPAYAPPPPRMGPPRPVWVDEPEGYRHYHHHHRPDVAWEHPRDDWRADVYRY